MCRVASFTLMVAHSGCEAPCDESDVGRLSGGVERNHCTVRNSRVSLHVSPRSSAQRCVSPLRAGGERGAVAQRVAVRTHVHRAAASVRCGHRSGVVRFAMAPTATAPTTGWAPPSVTGLLERIAANNVMQVVRMLAAAHLCTQRKDVVLSRGLGASQDRSLFVPFMLGNSVLGYLSARCDTSGCTLCRLLFHPAGLTVGVWATTSCAAS
jgi:hypothetical protein